jgi:hypothetical protein
MPISSNTRFKANVLKAVIDQLTGDSCSLQDRESSIKIVLTQNQVAWFSDFLDKQLDMKTKPDIEIDALGIILPVILRRSWPYVVGGAAGLTCLVLKAFK